MNNDSLTLNQEQLKRDMEVLMQETRERVEQREKEKLAEQLKKDERTELIRTGLEYGGKFALGALALAGLIKIIDNDYEADVEWGDKKIKFKPHDPHDKK